jgi:hypothetical protein
MAEVFSLSLIEALSHVPDRRSPLGLRHPLAAVLSLLSMGVMCGCRSVYAVLQWGREQRQEMAAMLGLGKHGIPSDAMMSNLLRRIDASAFERALQTWAAAWPAGRAVASVPEGISINGKTLRGARGHEVPGVHLLAAYAAWLGVVLNHVSAGATKEDGGEIAAAPALLQSLVLQGKVITGDAIHAQRDLCGLIVKKRGDYLLRVKDNQPKLHNELVDLFRSPCAPLLPVSKRISMDRGRRNGRSGPAASWPAGTSGRD